MYIHTNSIADIGVCRVGRRNYQTRNRYYERESPKSHWRILL